MGEFKMTTYTYDEYANGLLKSLDQTILLIIGDMQKLKEMKFDNITDSIKKSAKMSVYKHLLSVHLRRKKSVIKKAESKLPPFPY